MRITKANSTPVLILGGIENALSIVRSLGRKGIPVSVSAEMNCLALRSRYCREKYPIPPCKRPIEFWGDLLLAGQNAHLKGTVIFAGSDDAVEFLALYRTELEKEYILDDYIPSLHLAMLDKQKTLELAASVDIPIPKFWNIQSLEDITQIQSEIDFPVIIKPIHSHIFQLHYTDKLFIVKEYHELEAKVSEILARGLRIIVCEMIPGPDDLLSSYYTYHDKSGCPLFHFTKRVIRRHPMNSGPGSYHLTQWLPETAALGKQFFQRLNYRGFGNIEFKRDVRDGKLKVIECNPRFTAVQEILVRCGMDAALIIYNYLTGRPLLSIDTYKEHIRLLYPRNDFSAFRQLRSLGMLSFPRWLKSIAHRQTFPCFSMTDPWPTTSDILNRVGSKIRRVIIHARPS